MGTGVPDDGGAARKKTVEGRTCHGMCAPQFSRSPRSKTPGPVQTVDARKHKMGWLLVGFDLPVLTHEQRKCATDFRNFLLKDGFLMIQFSLYARPCVSFARQETHVSRVRAHVPEEGHVRILFVTRAQWERATIIQGKPAKDVEPEQIPEQCQLW